MQWIDHRRAKRLCRADSDGCSQFSQAGLLLQIFDRIGRTNKRFVEFGARRPAILNSSYFRLHEGWHGLLLDGAPGESVNGGSMDFVGVRELYGAPEGAPTVLRSEFITAENVNEVFTKHGVPASFDLLTIDIDGNDFWVVRALDTERFRPRVCCIEFSSYFTSNEAAMLRYDPDFVWRGRGQVTGSSLAALYIVMLKKRYSFCCEAAGEHAIFIADECVSFADQMTPIPFVVPRGWQWWRRLAGFGVPPDKWQRHRAGSAGPELFAGALVIAAVAAAMLVAVVGGVLWARERARRSPFPRARAHV